MEFLGSIILIRADDLGDLGDRKVVVIVKDYHRTHIGRQGVDYRLELLLCLLVDSVVIGKEKRLSKRSNFSCIVKAFSVKCGFLIVVHTLVIGNAVKPANEGFA